MPICFDDFKIDRDRFSLYRNGDPVPVEPLIFDTIVLLASHPERLFTRYDLMEKLWPGKVVTDATIAGAIKSARRVLGDDGRQQKYIKTVHGRGFCFVGKTDAAATPAPPGKHDIQSLLVMPFQNHLALPDGGLVASLSLEIERVLKRIPLLALSTEAGRYVGQSIAPTPRQIYEQIGVHYLVSGSVRKEQDRVRVVVQLIDTRAGFMRWSEQFLFGGKPEEAGVGDLAIDICAKLQPQISLAILGQIEAREGEYNAKSLYLRAASTIAIRGCHEKTFVDAAESLRQATRLDPQLAHAPAYLSLVLAFGYRIGVLSDRDAAKAEAIEMAERALDLDDMDTNILGYCGCALADVGMLERGMTLLRKSLRINETNPQAWVALGAAILLTGDVDRAVEYLDRGVRVSPLDGCLSVWRSLLAIALIKNGDLAAAEREAQMACEHNEKTHMSRIALALALLLSEDSAGAKRSLDEAFRIRPDLSPREIRRLVGADACRQLLALRA